LRLVKLYDLSDAHARTGKGGTHKEAKPEILPLLYPETEILFILPKEVDFVTYLVTFCK